MRSTRLRKFKNHNKKLLILFQIFCMWYCSLLTANYLTSTTEAYFNDAEEIENHLHADWQAVPPPNPGPIELDKSSLKFENQAGFDCVTGFYNFLKNGGDRDMQGPSTFVLYYQATGSPTPNNPGTELARGEIPIIKKGEIIKLSFLPADKPSKGIYKFMADQRPGHPGNRSLWGSEIKVTETQIKACKNWETSSTKQTVDQESTIPNPTEKEDSFEDTINEEESVESIKDESHNVLNEEMESTKEDLTNSSFDELE